MSELILVLVIANCYEKMLMTINYLHLDSYVFIWKNESISEKEEVWNVEKIFRRHVEDVSDLCWSPDSNFVVSGSVDNTAVLWDVKKGTPIHFWSEREHTGFVQGVAYDPLGEFSVTMCIDR